MLHIENDIKWFQELLDCKKTGIHELPEDKKEQVLNRCKGNLYILSSRLADVRKHKVKKCLAKEKFMKLGGEDWQKSKYSFVISSLQTSILQMQSCISQLLECNDCLLEIMAALNNDTNFCRHKVLDLNIQRNFFCLKDHVPVSEGPWYEKQRSDYWLKRRKHFKVSGKA